MIPVDAAILLLILVTLPLAAAVHLTSWGFHVLSRRAGRIPRDMKSWIEKRWLIWTSSGVLGVYAVCTAYGAWVEAHWVELTRTEIPVDRAVMGHDRFRIVHLSDLHLERSGRREHRAIELVKAAQPHLVILTGDYMNRREGASFLHEMLTVIEAPYGVYGVEGNWDTKFAVRTVFERAGARLLVDESELILDGKPGLRLVGHSFFPSKTLPELLEGLDDDAFTIYLHHSPDAVDELRNRGPDQRVDLFLTGHTHGGQVCLPLWGAVLTMTRHHKRFERGLYDVDGVPMYVNRGLGTGSIGPGIRFLARPEVAVIDLVAK